MKRLLALLGFTTVLVVVSASSALAQYPPTNVPSPEIDPSPAGSLPFTGANLSWTFLLLVALFVGGLILLSVGRRRSNV